MKVKLKCLVTTIMLVIMFGMFAGLSQVQATSTQDLQGMLDLVPNEMDIDLPEVEYQKASKIIADRVKQIWKEKGIDTQGIEISAFTSPLYLGKDKFYEADISVQIGGSTSSIDSKSKTIKIIYNNHNKYNSTDEQVIKNLKISAPKYVTYDFDNSISSNDFVDMIYNNIEKYYQSKTSDKTIQFCVEAGAGGGPLFDFGFHGTFLAIFKNDVLYDIRTISVPTICEMIVPENIGNAEQDCINYAVPKIKSYWDKNSTITLTKGAKIEGTSIEIDNGYTIKANGSGIGTIILKKEKSESTNQLNDNKTGITIQGNNIPENTTIEVSKLTNGNTFALVEETLEEVANKFTVYEINLLKDNTKVQPNGKVKVSIPIPNGYDTNNLAIYRIEENGTKTKYDVKVETIDGKKYATFETDHFSTYVLAELKQQDTTTPTQSDNNKEKDDTPKTGIYENVVVVLGIMIVSIAGIVIVNKKRSNVE